MMKKIKINNEIKEIRKVSELIHDFAAAYSLANQIVFALDLAIDELLTNIISYAYCDEQEHLIEIEIEFEAELIKLTIIDEGKSFNPLQQASPDLESEIETREIGGLGIHFVKEKMDKLAYKRENNKNILTLIKNI